MKKEPFTNWRGERLTNKEIIHEIHYQKGDIKGLERVIKEHISFLKDAKKDLKIYEKMLENRRNKKL
jgi:hypothetical protein